MERKKVNFAGITIFLLAISILVMSIGFAAQATVLKINGNTQVGITPKWDVHFSNLNIEYGSVSDELVNEHAKIVDERSTYITYDVKLPHNRDYYEFTVDVVNDGNLDALIGSVILSGYDEDAQKSISYNVTYVDTNEDVKMDDELLKGETRKIRVHIENIYELEQTDLGEATYALSLAIQYVQK